MQNFFSSPLWSRVKIWRRRLWLLLRLGFLLLIIALLLDRNNDNPRTMQTRVLSATRGHTFNYVEWEVDALLSKAQQELFGFHAYISEVERKQLVLEYVALQNQLWTLEGQIEAASGDSAEIERLTAEHTRIQGQMADIQPLVEHIIEGQVSAVLRDEGFAVLGQILPPVTMHFLDIPDVLVVSPRHEIRTAMTVTLNPMDFNARLILENRIAQAVPDQSVWITPVSGVGIYPSMVRETDRPTIAFEVTAHEWLHHYLLFFPLGLEYLSLPDTRIINETTATVFGKEIGNLVIERYYADELAAGQVYLQEIPDYRTLLAAVEGSGSPVRGEVEVWNPPAFTLDTYENNRGLVDYLLFLGKPDTAQLTLNLQARHAVTIGYLPPVDPTHPRPDTDRRGWVYHTRVNVDYLLSLGRVDAAEWAMENGRQHTGQRVLNQAWFAFNAGYQENPVIERQADGSVTLVTDGGGGDPIGAAIYEIRARAGSLRAFVDIMRDITTREELFAALERLRTDSTPGN